MLSARSIPTKAEIQEACRRQCARAFVKGLADLRGTVSVPDAAAQRACLAIDSPDLAAADVAVMERWCEGNGLKLFTGRPDEQFECQVTQPVMSELWWELLLRAVPEAHILARLLGDLRGGRTVGALDPEEVRDMLAVRRALYAVAAAFACERGEVVPALRGALMVSDGGCRR